MAVPTANVQPERRVGELLRQTPKTRAGSPPENRSSSSTDLRQPKTIGECGITKDQSPLWADAQEEEIEAEVATPVTMPTEANIGSP
jgi:hypothetical protein